MKRLFVKGTVFVFWAVMLAWLIRYEAFPHYFSHSLAGYRDLVSSDILIEDSWSKILFNGRPIGYSHTHEETEDSSITGRYVIENHIELCVNLMGTTRRIHAETTVRLDAAFSLQRFSFQLSSGEYSLLVKGIRWQERTFDVSVRTVGGTERLLIEIPDDVIIESPAMALALERLKPGQHLVMRVFDPAMFATASLTVRALRKEPLEIGGTNYLATVLEIDYRGAAIKAWLADGQMLRQETPYGWTLERCSAEEAFEALRAAHGGEDMLTGMAVKCDGAISNPTGARMLRLRLSGVALEGYTLESNRQKILDSDASGIELLVSQAEPGPSEAKSLVTPELQNFLAPSLFVQADHPEIQAQALRIVHSRETALEKARAICAWVNENVEKELTVSVPSALDVLRVRKGDCNEHTYLFAALARAAGLPCKVKLGVVYHEGTFYYHAWPAVFVGDWLEMDPTLGQMAVDATHVALLEGDLANHLELVRIIGRLRIKVLEEIQ